MVQLGKKLQVHKKIITFIKKIVMIKINKQLQRPDKGMLAAGSILDAKTRFIPNDLTVVWNLTHWFNELAKETAKEDVWFPVVGVNNFGYIQSKICTPEEWAMLDEAGTPELLEGWLQKIIDKAIGEGNTEII